MQLINGDCLEELKDLSDNSVDLIFLDLPYNQTSCEWDVKIDLNKLWLQLKRVRKNNCLAIFSTTTKYGYELIHSNKKEFRYDLCFVKSAPVGHLNARKMPLRKHEMLYVFAKNGYTKNNKYDISSHKVQYDYERDPVEKGVHIYGDSRKSKIGVYSPKLPTSILRIKSTRGQHQTEKPVELMKWILKYYSKEGDTVLDPTMGSGSMGQACKELNRKFIGIELNKYIFETAKKRL